MVMPYENWEAAHQHLSETVVMYDGRPVYCTTVAPNQTNRADIVVRLTPMPRLNDHFEVSIFDPLFDAKSMGERLGYVNLGRGWGATWTSRIPSRSYKQGLSRHNLFVTRSVAMGGNYSFTNMLRNAAFCDALINIYPTFDEAIKVLEADREIPSVAFDKNFSLERQDLGYYLLTFRNERVAWGDPREFKLPKKFIYLKETLERLGVNYSA